MFPIPKLKEVSAMNANVTIVTIPIIVTQDHVVFPRAVTAV